MKNGEFVFKGVSLLKQYGLVAGMAEDVVLPQLRERKVTIPGRDGQYDYGAENYDERTFAVRLRPTRPLTRSEIREVSYLLSQKGKIIMWDEPDKYYIGRIYDAQPLLRLDYDHPGIDVEFVCEPFAYTDPRSIPLSTGSNQIKYSGTHRTPAVIQIKNTGTSVVNGIVITITKRSD